MSKPVAMIHGKPDRQDPIEMSIYNQAGNTNYSLTARLLLSSYFYSSNEIIDTLCKIKQDIQNGPHRKRNLKHFMHNCGILIAELIKAHPTDEGLKHICKYVSTPYRSDRELLKNENTKILNSFQNLMTISLKASPDEGLALLSMKRAWQRIRSAAQNSNTFDPAPAHMQNSSAPISKVTPQLSVLAQTFNSKQIIPETSSITMNQPKPTSRINISSFKNKLKSQAGKIYDRIQKFKSTQSTPVFEIRIAPAKPASSNTPEPANNQRISATLKAPKPNSIEIQKGPFEELVATEKMYIKTLSTLNDDSIKKVLNDYMKNEKKEKYAKKGYAKPEELAAFMQTVAKLATAHQGILSCFEMANQSQGKERAQYLQQGIELVARLQNEYLQCSIAMTLLKIPPDLKVNGADKSISDTSLTSILSNPFQRVARYPMQLEEMVKVLKKQDNQNTELDNVFLLAKSNALAINKLTSASLAAKEYSQTPTNANLSLFLDNLSTPQISDEHKKRMLSAIPFSKIDNQGIIYLQQFAQNKNNRSLLPFISKLVAEGRMINHIQKAMPKNTHSPEAAFLKTLLTHIRAQGTARRDNPAIATPLVTNVAIEDALKAFKNAGGKEDIGAQMATQYASLLNAIQNEIKTQFLPTATSDKPTLSKALLSQYQQPSSPIASTVADTPNKLSTVDKPHMKNKS